MRFLDLLNCIVGGTVGWKTGTANQQNGAKSLIVGQQRISRFCILFCNIGHEMPSYEFAYINDAT